MIITKFTKVVTDTADDVGLYGTRRIVFYAISPFIALIAFIGGFVAGTIEGIKDRFFN